MKNTIDKLPVPSKDIHHKTPSDWVTHVFDMTDLVVVRLLLLALHVLGAYAALRNHF